jgi:hypothetical protein
LRLRFGRILQRIRQSLGWVISSIRLDGGLQPFGPITAPPVAQLPALRSRGYRSPVESQTFKSWYYRSRKMVFRVQEQSHVANAVRKSSKSKLGQSFWSCGEAYTWVTTHVMMVNSSAKEHRYFEHVSFAKCIEAQLLRHNRPSVQHYFFDFSLNDFDQVYDAI